MKNFISGLLFSIGLSSASYADVEFTSTKGPSACLRNIALHIVENDPVLKDYTVANVKDSGSRQQLVTITSSKGEAVLIFRAFTGTWILGNSQFCYTPAKADLYNSEILYKVENSDRSEIIHTIYGSVFQTELEKIQMMRSNQKISGGY